MKNISKRKIKTGDSKRIINEITKEFNFLIERLIDRNICLDHVPFSINNNGNIIEITRSDRKNESNILYDSTKTVDEMMEILLKKSEYNLLMYDKGIIQFELMIENGEIIKERFIYINKQNGMYNIEQIKKMENDENNVDWYEEINGIPVLIRMDYDKVYDEDSIHPMSHFTISNCDCCRIPMKGPMSISMFVNFILNMFYNDNVDGIKTIYDKKETLKKCDKDKLYLYWN